MKATGIIRRIDDLGRIVIPKEIRKHLGIREGDSLEIFIDEENQGVVFSPYRANEGIKESLNRIIDIYYDDMLDYSNGNKIISELKNIVKSLENS